MVSRRSTNLTRINTSLGWNLREAAWIASPVTSKEAMTFSPDAGGRLQSHNARGYSATLVMPVLQRLVDGQCTQPSPNGEINGRYPKRVNIRSLVVGLNTLTLGITVSAQGQQVAIDAALHSGDKPYIRVMGEATVSAKPDQAVVEIGVISQGSTPVGTAAQNAKQTEAVLASITHLLHEGKGLRTTNYSVRPNFKYKVGEPTTINGYTATNVVQITLDDLAQVSKVIDAATQSGANSIQKLQYRLKNPGAVRAQALREAAEQAKVSGEAIASGLGLKVVRVMSAEEVTSEDGVVYKKSAAAPPPPAGTTPATPVEIGMIEVDVNVVLRLEIGQ